MNYSRLKVLHLITRLVVGGAQDNTLLTVEKHSRNKFEVHLASHPEGQWFDRAQQVTDVFHALPNLVNPISPIDDFKTLSTLIKLLQKEQFDVVHTHSSKAGILGRVAAKIAKVPVIVHTIHGFAFHDFMPTWKRKIYINLERGMRPCTDFFLTVSELNRQQAIELEILSAEKSKTVYSGIDLTKLDRPCNTLEIRQQLNIPDGWQTIVMVGRLDQQKAPYFLIDAFYQVLKQFPKTLLFFIGEGELQPQLEAQTQELGIKNNVKFLGSREDVPEILKIADIFALSSLWEGLGRAMTEAMLLGKPVVVPNIYGIPETVHHGETGLLFPAKNVEKLADNLVCLLQNTEKREYLGNTAKQLTRKLFDVNEMVKQIEIIYEQLRA